MKLKLQTVENSYAQNSFVNGDFQSWQRGDSVTTNGSKTEYTCDMWATSYKTTVSKVENGLKTTNDCHLIQLLPKVEKGEKYAISCSINNSEYSMIIEGGTFKETEQMYYSPNRETSGLSMFVFKLKANDVLNWVHKNDGEISHKHRKEDKAITLMRCLPFCERAKFTATATGAYFMDGFSYKMPKEKNPVINILHVADSDGKVNENDFSFSVIDKYFANFIRYKGGSCESLKNKIYTFDVLITCESL